MAFETTRNRTRNVYCVDCLARQETTTYEMKRAARVRCHCCGGNVVKKSELSNEAIKEIEREKQLPEKPISKSADNASELFPNHEYTEQSDGTWRSPQYIFSSDRWQHYKSKEGNQTR